MEEQDIIFKELTISTKKLLDIKGYCINKKEIYKYDENIKEILDYILKIINS